MSKKPYVVQEDSPNLVIVPTDTLYESSSKRFKESDLPLQSTTSETSVFARKPRNSNFGGVNSDVLIDVQKVQKTSWATNFLQSIGGSTTKFNRPMNPNMTNENVSPYAMTSVDVKNYWTKPMYPTTAKSTSLSKNNSQQEIKAIPARNAVLHSYKPTTDINLSQPFLDEPKININLTKPREPQATMINEVSQINSETKTDEKIVTQINQGQVHKVPTLPKNYKIPMQSKHKTPEIQPGQPEKETTKPNSTYQSSNKLNTQSMVSLSDDEADVFQPKHHTTAFPNVKTHTEDARSKRFIDQNHSKHDSKDFEPVQIHDKMNANASKLTGKQKTMTDINQYKTKKVTNQHSDQVQAKNSNKRMISSRLEKTSCPINKNKENHVPKYKKGITERKLIKLTDLPITHKEPTEPKNRKENNNLKKSKEITEAKTKLKKNQDPTVSTKLKIKKGQLPVKSKIITKHRDPKENISHKIRQTKADDRAAKQERKNTDKKERKTLQSSLGDDTVTKSKMKRVTEKASEPTNVGRKNKKIKLDTAPTKTETSKSTDTRLSKSISPIKSVVSKIKTDHQSYNNSKQSYNKESNYYHSQFEKSCCSKYDYHCHDSEKPIYECSNIDLRTKLKRRTSKTGNKVEYKRRHDKNNKFATVPNGDRFVPDDNLIISFNAEDNSAEKNKLKFPVKKLARKQSAGNKKSKKVNFQINILFNQENTTDEESTESENEIKDDITENMINSFLDDINVDEIAQTLNELTRKMSREDIIDDSVNVRLSSKRKTIETITSEESTLFKNNRAEFREKLLVENNQESITHSPTIKKQRPLEPEQRNDTFYPTIDLIKKETLDDGCLATHGRSDNNQKIKIDTETDTFHNEAQIVCSKVPDVKSILNNIIQPDIPANVSLHEPQEHIAGKIEVVGDAEENDTKLTLSSLDSNMPVVNTLDSSDSSILDIKTNISEGQIILDFHNSKPHSDYLDIPVTTKSSESNLYSDNNDIIDTLQDNNKSEINAIKSYIESLNKTEEADKKSTEHAKVSITTDYSENEAQKTGLFIMSTLKTIEPVDIKEDPDVIILDDSDAENDTIIKSNQSINDKNVKALEFDKECVLDLISDDEMTIDPAKAENPEPIMILDTDYNIEHDESILNADENDVPLEQNIATEKDKDTVNTNNFTIEEDSKEIKTNRSTALQYESEKAKDKMTELVIKDIVTESAKTEDVLQSPDENGVPLEQNITTETRVSDDEMTIDPAKAENPEPILIFDTDYTIEHDESILNVDKNDVPLEQNIATEKDKDTVNTNKFTIVEDSKEIKTNRSTALQYESEKAKDKITELATKDIVTESAKTENLLQSPLCKDDKDIESKDIESKSHGISSDVNRKTSNDSLSDTPTEGAVVPKKCIPKSDTANSKIPNVNKKPVAEVQNNNEAQSSNKATEICTSYYSKFVETLLSKLFFILGRKCTVTQLIHTGKYSKIFHCKDALKRDYAVKSLKKKVYHNSNLGPDKENMLLNLQQGVPEHNLNCVHLIKGLTVNGFWCFLMEYYPMNLKEALEENKRSFHIDVVQSLSRQLVSAVTILRNNNIIHSDIKPSHILINSSLSRIKLCGFDQASYFADRILLPITGTVNYRAPELILGYPAGYGVDVWSTGLVMYEMATCRKLFPGTYNNSVLYQQLCTLGPIPLEMLMDCSYRNEHFRGTAFLKFVGANERIVINEMKYNDILNTSLYKAYALHWAKGKTSVQKWDDKSKISAFSELLASMLIMHPRGRISIEFVFANPFIYETFDDC